MKLRYIPAAIVLSVAVASPCIADPFNGSKAFPYYVVVSTGPQRANQGLGSQNYPYYMFVSSVVLGPQSVNDYVLAYDPLSLARVSSNTMSVSGNNILIPYGVTFGTASGNGAAITNLTAGNISAGTAGINISGSAASVSGNVPTSQIDLSTIASALNTKSSTGTCTSGFVMQTLASGYVGCISTIANSGYATTSGNAVTATALAAAGTSAGSGFFALGEDASGNAILGKTDSTPAGISGSTWPYTSGAAYTALAGKANSFVGISSSDATGLYLSSPTISNGVITGGYFSAVSGGALPGGSPLDLQYKLNSTTFGGMTTGIIPQWALLSSYSGLDIVSNLMNGVATDGTYAYVAGRSAAVWSHSVAKYTMAGAKVAETTNLLCDIGITLGETGYIYVAGSDDTVSKIRTSDMSIIWTQSVGAYPYGVYTRGNYVWTPNNDGSVSRLNLDGSGLVNSGVLSGGWGVNMIAFDPDGLHMYAGSGNGNSGKIFKFLESDASSSIIFDPGSYTGDTSGLVFLNGSLWAIDRRAGNALLNNISTTGSVLSSHALPATLGNDWGNNSPYQGYFGTDGVNLFIMDPKHTAYAYNQSGTQLANFGGGNQPGRLAVSNGVLTDIQWDNTFPVVMESHQTYNLYPANALASASGAVSFYNAGTPTAGMMPIATSGGAATWQNLPTPQLPVLTMSQISTVTPTLGQQVLCADCTVPYDVCVGTGTVVAGFRATILTAISTVVPGTVVPMGCQQ